MQPTKLEKTKSLIQKGLITLFVLTVVVFSARNLYPLMHGPTIDMATLVNGESVQNPMIRVSGIASFTKDLLVNGKSLALSPDGSFDENLVLNPGYNLINVQGTDRFGKTNRETYAMVLTEKPSSESLSINVPNPMQNH